MAADHEDRMMVSLRNWLTLVALGLSAGAGSARADYPDCLPGTPTPAALTAWRAAAVTAAAASDNSNNNFGPSGPSPVAVVIDKCFPSHVPACMQRLRTYTGRFDTGDGSKEPAIEAIPQKQPPAEFLAPGATGLQYLVPPNVEQLAASKGWLSARYKSRHSGGFDPQTSSLLMVYVPGDKVSPPVTYDRWLNFALPADAAPNELTPVPQANWPSAAEFAAETTSNADYPRTFTMITMDRATATTPAAVYFQKFDRNGSNSGIYTPEFTSFVNECISCHPNGMRAISPLGYHVRAGEPQLPPAMWTAVDDMNDAMDNDSGGKLVSWRMVPNAAGVMKPMIKPEAVWPIVGPIKPVNAVSRTEAFIMGGTLPDGSTSPGCYKRRTTVDLTDIFGRPQGRNNVYTLSASPKVNWKNVRNAMLCETCHNNRDRYAINTSTDPAQTDFKILVDQSMPFSAHQDPMEQGDPSVPPSDSLTPDERIALANCLQAELELEQTQLSKWLTQTSCQ